MATVNFDHAPAATDSSLLSKWMTSLHARLIAAGWTIEYADSDAIGGGSAGTPAWDKSAANNTDAGVAVYRMPANGGLTRWFVRLRPGWAGNVVRPHMRGITIGNTHNGSGTVTGPGGEIVAGTVAIATNSVEFMTAASEDGFLVFLNAGSNSVLAHVERIRLRSGVQDELLAINKYSTGDLYNVVSEASVTPNVPLLFLNPQRMNLSALNVASHSPYLDSNIELGPYTAFGDPLTLPPRLWRMVTPAAFPAGSTYELDIDGGLKMYRVADSTLVLSGAIAVATE